MTKREFDHCFQLADSDRDFSDADDSVLHGCGLPGFQRVTAEPVAVAKFLRWHCLNLNGTWDSSALNDFRSLFRIRVEVVGVPV